MSSHTLEACQILCSWVALKATQAWGSKGQQQTLLWCISCLLMHLPHRLTGCHLQNTKSKLILFRVSRLGTEEHETKPGALLSKGPRRGHRLQAQKLALLVEPQPRLLDDGNCVRLLVLPSASALHMSSTRQLTRIWNASRVHRQQTLLGFLSLS